MSHQENITQIDLDPNAEGRLKYYTICSTLFNVHHVT